MKNNNERSKISKPTEIDKAANLILLDNDVTSPSKTETILS
jgi:hypothetical protein